MRSNVASVSPGPNVLIVVGNTLKHGTRDAVFTILGNLTCHFGSALVPRTDKDGRPKISQLTKALTGFHKVYSRIVLALAKWQLKRIGHKR